MPYSLRDVEIIEKTDRCTAEFESSFNEQRIELNFINLTITLT